MRTSQRSTCYNLHPASQPKQRRVAQNQNPTLMTVECRACVSNLIYRFVKITGPVWPQSFFQFHSEWLLNFRNGQIINLHCDFGCSLKCIRQLQWPIPVVGTRRFEENRFAFIIATGWKCFAKYLRRIICHHIVCAKWYQPIEPRELSKFQKYH